jgi:Holliday junction resolvase-like predicted endonuclease
VGEYLVAAELARLGLITATFSGSVPDYDIIATDSNFRAVFVQVKALKAVKRRNWQFDIRRFVKVRLHGKKQVLGRLVREKHDISCVMVALTKYGDDRFYVLSWRALQELVVNGYRKYLKRHGGVRPKKYNSFHCGIGEHDLVESKDAWLAEFRDRRKLSVVEPNA